MLILTCRIGDTLRIGDGIHVTLQGRLRNRVTVGLLAPTEAAVMLDRACLQPVALPGGANWYLFSLLGVRRFRVGDVEAADTGRRQHGQALGHAHANLVALQELEHVGLDAVVGAGGVTGSWADAFVFFSNHVVHA